MSMALFRRAGFAIQVLWSLPAEPKSDVPPAATMVSDFNMRSLGSTATGIAVSHPPPVAVGLPSVSPA